MDTKGIIRSDQYSKAGRLVAAILLLQFLLLPFVQLLHHHDHESDHRSGLDHGAIKSSCTSCTYFLNQQPIHYAVTAVLFSFKQSYLKELFFALTLHTPERYADSSCNRGPPRS